MFTGKPKLHLFVPPTRRSFSSCRVAYAGHNKWSKIKQKKGAKDAQRSVVFGKAARDIFVAARSGGSIDPSKNMQLTAVLKRARDMDVPKENIEKALAKANWAKDQAGGTFIYEALAFNSVGLIVECATDNNNRTIHNLREILNGYGAHATPVKFMFRRLGYFTFNRIVDPSLRVHDDEEKTVELIEEALSRGALDFGDAKRPDGSESPSVWFTCDTNNLKELTASIREHFPSWELGVAEARYLPQHSPSKGDSVSTEVKDELNTLIQELEANEDVLQVWTSIPPEE